MYQILVNEINYQFIILVMYSRFNVGPVKGEFRWLNKGDLQLFVALKSVQRPNIIVNSRHCFYRKYFRRASLQKKLHSPNEIRFSQTKQKKVENPDYWWLKRLLRPIITSWISWMNSSGISIIDSFFNVLWLFISVVTIRVSNDWNVDLICLSILNHVKWILCMVNS